MIAYLILANLFLAGRLIYLKGDGSRHWLWLVVVTFVQIGVALAVLRLAIASWWVLALFGALAVLVALVPVVDWCAKKRLVFRLTLRLGTLLVGLFIIGVFANNGGAEVSTEFQQFAALFQANSTFGPLFAQINWVQVLVHTFGLFLCLVESSTIVRLSLELMAVHPPESTASRFKHSAQTGAIERVLIYLFVYHSAFNAVAFVLTAKSVARVHELTTSEAAEYVLLGTLVSTLMGIAISLLLAHVVIQ